ncbi:hypothetical protein OGAPHI_002575 [Ogataea philodendri]|uniref:Uncharacterized protein n=1 Tax=Ogataea philodendri TaxID=1378263 RepID=A0A9P8PBU9_9ASCO|nr:uncharacterized protein OGAPHI_002575 [Ogataea philodendri]KAH3668820.1 hypothetical protein OGAPHI_002575 [Ogataea philodendri]
MLNLNGLDNPKFVDTEFQAPRLIAGITLLMCEGNWNASPRKAPFLVIKIESLIKLTPHPTTSLLPNLQELLKLVRPSSKWINLASLPLYPQVFSSCPRNELIISSGWSPSMNPTVTSAPELSPNTISTS